jgi:transcriptional regulator with XRE-family HTH domain
MKSFGETLKKARVAGGLSRKQFAARVNSSTTEVGFWETDRRLPTPERQAELLAACRLPEVGISATVSDLMAQYESDVRARLSRLHGDLQTAISATDATPHADAAVSRARPARRRAAN